MKKKINSKNLFVACKVSVNDYLIESFVQYETFGKEYHEVVINPRRELVLMEEVNGEKIYKYIPTNEEIEPRYYPKSYSTQSSPHGSIYGGYIGGKFNPGISEIIENIKYHHYKKINQLGYLVPFDEYIQNVLGIKLTEVTIHQARTLVRFTNLIQPRSFALSDDIERAEEQINTKVFRKKKK